MIFDGILDLYTSTNLVDDATYGFWGLIILVAIPLPGTGAWTGALVAAFLNLRLKDAIPAIFIGVCIAAAVMTGLTFGVIHAF